MSDYVKLVVLGSCATGKTCIINRLVYNEFKPDVPIVKESASEQYKFVYEEFNGRELVLNLWEASGLLKYKSLSKIFCKDSGIAILVYDITSKYSFEELKSEWLPLLHDCGIVDASKEINFFNLYKYIYSYWDSCE